MTSGSGGGFQFRARKTLFTPDVLFFSPSAKPIGTRRVRWIISVSQRESDGHAVTRMFENVVCFVVFSMFFCKPPILDILLYSASLKNVLNGFA